MCMYYKACIRIPVGGSFLIYCSLKKSLMVSHSTANAVLWNHFGVNMIRKRYYLEKSVRNAGNFSMQPNFSKAQAEEVKKKLD